MLLFSIVTRTFCVAVLYCDAEILCDVSILSRPYLVDDFHVVHAEITVGDNVAKVHHPHAQPQHPTNMLSAT